MTAFPDDRRSKIVRMMSRTSRLFHARFREPLHCKYPNLLADSFDALCYFLEGFAFERNGSSPHYRALAPVIVMEAKKHPSGAIAEIVWKNFTNANGGKGLNEKVNPLFHEADGGKKNCRCVWCVMGGENVVAFAKESLEKGQTDVIYSRLTAIRGIGPKIASLFLLDISSCYGIKVRCEPHLIQPVDLWIRRIVSRLAGNAGLKDSETACWIVKNCDEPELANMGFWYFSSQVSRAEWILERCLDDFAYANRLLDEHMAGLIRAADALKKSAAELSAFKEPDEK
jgi:hypothetical protein